MSRANSSSVKIIVDVHERQSGIAETLRELGADVEIASLPAGDYAVGADTLVERKRVLDLHAAVLKGRLWPQLGKLRAACASPYLLVEGTDIDRGPLHSPRGTRGEPHCEPTGIRAATSTEAGGRNGGGDARRRPWRLDDLGPRATRTVRDRSWSHHRRAVRVAHRAGINPKVAGSIPARPISELAPRVCRTTCYRLLRSYRRRPQVME
jgi:hypothetical protein